MSKKRGTIFIDEIVLKKIKLLAIKQNKSFSIAIENAIKDYLEKNNINDFVNLDEIKRK